jgi:hypothetical protein
MLCPASRKEPETRLLIEQDIGICHFRFAKNPGVSASRHQQYPNYFILDGKIRIGRIYKEEAPTHPELPWFWSLMVRGKGQPNIQGHDATLPQAKLAIKLCGVRYPRVARL